jgi:hypothetical protein
MVNGASSVAVAVGVGTGVSVAVAAATGVAVEVAGSGVAVGIETTALRVDVAGGLVETASSVAVGSTVGVAAVPIPTTDCTNGHPYCHRTQPIAASKTTMTTLSTKFALTNGFLGKRSMFLG